MLLRKDSAGVIAIPQPCHAWLSGQLARAWGNERFAAPVPAEEVCLAAGHHDIGWHSWEMRPALDAETGLPQEFFQVPIPVHTALWRDGVCRARAFGRYPALLISLHAATIYGAHFDATKADPASAEAVQSFLAEQRSFQAQLAASLRSDASTAGEASPANLEYNRLLIAALDWMSLEICWGIAREITIPNVPMAEGGRTEISLRAAEPAGEDLIVEPWPFREASVTVRAEGKRLRSRYSSKSDLQRALDEAEAVPMKAVLRRP
jgi:hypothetical protein